jgi:hypothetical protein
VADGHQEVRPCSPGSAVGDRAFDPRLADREQRSRRGIAHWHERLLAIGRGHVVGDAYRGAVARLGPDPVRRDVQGQLGGRGGRHAVANRHAEREHAAGGDEKDGSYARHLAEPSAGEPLLDRADAPGPVCTSARAGRLVTPRAVTAGGLCAGAPGGCPDRGHRAAAPPDDE